eukprot:gene11627-biopygen1845
MATNRGTPPSHRIVCALEKVWQGGAVIMLWGGGGNDSGRAPDARRTTEFEETDARRTRAGRARSRFSLGPQFLTNVGGVAAEKLCFLAFLDSALSIDTRVTPP